MMCGASDRDSRRKLVAEHLLDVLIEWGVRTVFICPGSTEAAFLHAATDRDDLDIILTTHESITVAMADAHARATATPAVAILHANVGLTNGLSHLYAARLANSPVVVLNGLKQTEIQGRGGFTTARHMTDFVRQYCLFSWQSLRADAVATDVGRALQVSQTTPQGPTWVGLAQDLLETSVDHALHDRNRYSVMAEVRAPRKAVRQTVDLLLQADRPIIVAGSDVASAAADGLGVQLLSRLAAELKIPVFTEDRRGFERTVLPSTDPHHVGMYDVRRTSVAESDLAIFLGAKCFVDFEVSTLPGMPEGAEVVHIHPEPAEVAKIHGVSVAAVSDSTAFLEDVLVELATRPSRSRRGGSLAAARDEQLQLLEELLPGEPADGQITVGQVMDALAADVDEGTLLVGDATTSGKLLIHAAERSGATLHTTSSGALGWGVGAAMGFKLAQPGKRVVAVCGDGAFQFGIPGLWTAHRYNIDVTYLVINNEAYAAVGAALRRYSGDVSERERSLAVDLSGPSLSAVARGFGILGFAARTMQEFRQVLNETKETEGPCVVEVFTNPLDLGP